MTVCVTPLPATQHKCRNGRKWPVRRLRKQPQLYIPLVVPFTMSLLSFRNIHDPDKKPDDLFFPPCRSTLVDSTDDAQIYPRSTTREHQWPATDATTTTTPVRSINVPISFGDQTRPKYSASFSNLLFGFNWHHIRLVFTSTSSYFRRRSIFSFLFFFHSNDGELINGYAYLFGQREFEKQVPPLIAAWIVARGQ